jgi:hypothetical protein
MKRCSQCGNMVPDSAQVGQRCPRCGLTWQAERQDTYTYKKSREKSGCSWWVVILIVIMTITIGMPILIKSKRVIDENRIITQWLMLNLDSLTASKQLIMQIKSPQRDSVFKRISERYAGAIEREEGQYKSNLMMYSTRIDSVFSDSVLNFRIIYPNAIYRKLLDISTNTDLLQTIRNKADSALQILNHNR